MRTILFRGKWVYGSFICRETLLDYDSGFIEVIPETVGQFTGLFDKNERAIFEGDIIKCTIIYDVGCYPRFESKIREVKYIEGCFMPLYNCERNTYEVIGNIHDNPELMERQNG